jgi:4'-phosphopantetheinyl transferase
VGTLALDRRGTAAVPVCDTGPAMRCRPAMGAGRVGLPAPFGEAWRRPLAAGLGDIFVWWVPADSAGGLLGQSGMLDGHDWAAIGRIRDVALRDHARATRIALRLALSHAVAGAVSPRGWRFSRTSYGKPQIAPELPQMHFCMSHTDAVSVIAVSAHAPVGVDAETMVESLDDKLVASFCSAAERRALARLPAGERQRAFTELWTLKEAYSKLTGTGLATDFRSVAFQVETGRQVADRHTEHRLGDARLISWHAEAAGGLAHVSVAVDASDPMEDGGELVCCTAAGPATRGSA